VFRGGIALVAALSACAKKPPADFAPDPGLVARIHEIRMEVPVTACPGQTFRADYIAAMDDGEEIPFAASYDKKHPPALHVVFLSRYSAQATALENGNWAASPDPLASAVTGFHVRALMRANPRLIAEVVVPPSYECLDHTLEFVGARGRSGRDGGPGPDVTVRLGLVRSPFVERLIVAEVTVEQAPPLYVLADAEYVDPADWLRVAALGGPGSRGSDGAKGQAGRAGAPGCPGRAGEAGSAGGDGERGGDGGPGGHVTVIVAEEEPFLAGLVDARTDGGPGGDGGRGGKGGAGGAGGAATGDARRCKAGPPGPAGADGRDGPDGRGGRPGPRAQVITVPAASVFGTRPRPELEALLTYHSGDDR
jgi:hypothetical protein